MNVALPVPKPWPARLPPGARLLLALVSVVGLAVVPPTALAVVAGTAGLVAVGVWTAGVPRRAFRRRLLQLEPLVLGVVLLAVVRGDAWQHVAGLALRSTTGLAVVLLLAWTTPMPEVLRVLARCRLPALLLTTLALLHRYLGVLQDEALAMRRARLARTFTTDRRRQWRDLAGVIAQLFVRAAARAERIHAAMLARGWR